MNDTATADSRRVPASPTAALANPRPRVRLRTSGAVALILAFCAFALAGSRQAGAAAGQSTITVKAFEYDDATGALGAALPNFTFIVSLDNSPNPDNVDPTKRPGVAPMPSHAPLMATGDQDHATVTLPDSSLHMFDLADSVVFEQLERTSEHRMEHVMETLGEDEPTCFCLIDHRAGLSGIHRDRLLRQNVQSSLECVRRPLEPRRGG